MEDRAPVTNSSSAATPPSSAETPQREGRNVWVLTAYGVSGLALLAVLAYYVSNYIAQH
jgi:hypothetical protein